MSGVIYLQQPVNKNYLKNPAFSVIQGTASGTVPNSFAAPTASLGYPGETEWAIVASGGTPAYAFSQENQSLTITGAASTGGIFLINRLESKDAAQLAGKTVTFSFETSNTLLSSVSVGFTHPSAVNDTFGTLAVQTLTSISGRSFTVDSTLTRYSTTFTIPALTSRGLQVIMSVGAQTLGTWIVARPKLELGSVATPFTCDDYLTELQKCQRYYYIGTPSILGSGNGSSSVRMAGKHLVEMFAAPVPTLSGTVTVFSGSVGNTTISSLGANLSTTKNLEFVVNLPASTVTGDALIAIQSTGGTISASAHIP